jgi:hypothetical protein
LKKILQIAGFCWRLYFALKAGGKLACGATTGRVAETRIRAERCGGNRETPALFPSAKICSPIVPVVRTTG